MYYIMSNCSEFTLQLHVPDVSVFSKKDIPDEQVSLKHFMKHTCNTSIIAQPLCPSRVIRVMNSFMSTISRHNKLFYKDNLSKCNGA